MPTTIQQEHLKMLFIHISVFTQYKTSHPVSCSSSKFEAFHSDPCKHVKKNTIQTKYIFSFVPFKQIFSSKNNHVWGNSLLSGDRERAKPLKTEFRTRKTQVSYQVDVVKDESGFVHLAKDEKHLVVNELFVLLQVTVHMLFQLCSYLPQKEEESIVSCLDFVVLDYTNSFTERLQDWKCYVTTRLRIYVDRMAQKTTFQLAERTKPALKPVE